MSRKRIEEKYGPFASSGIILFVRGGPVSLKAMMRKLDLLREDIAPVDCGVVKDGVNFVRFVDFDDRTIRVLEFDDDFSVTGETRSDLMHWMGDDYFRAKWRVFCPGGGEEWLGHDMTKKK